VVSIRWTTCYGAPVPRTRDADAQQRILDATFELLGTEDAGTVGIDQIARAAGVGKQTIYRWWPSKHAVVIDALLTRSIKATPFHDTGDPKADVRHHMRGVVRLFSSNTGAVIRNVLGEAQRDSEVSDDFVTRFWEPRRELSRAFLQRAIEREQVRADIDIEAALDAIYSPLWTRLLIGYDSLDYKLVDNVLAVAWPGLERPRP